MTSEYNGPETTAGPSLRPTDGISRRHVAGMAPGRSRAVPGSSPIGQWTDAAIRRTSTGAQPGPHGNGGLVSTETVRVMCSSSTPTEVFVDCGHRDIRFLRPVRPGDTPIGEMRTTTAAIAPWSCPSDDYRTPKDDRFSTWWSIRERRNQHRPGTGGGTRPAPRVHSDEHRRTVETVSSGAAPTAAEKGSSPWARVFAALYDPLLWLGERLGMATRRQELVGRARGRTVELGSGTGLNLRHYPGELDELTLTEPEAAMRTRLARRLRREGSRARVLDAPAERLPFADATVDTVVSTLVLCTVDDPGPVLREVERVLQPGGRLLFLEHVRSRSPRLSRWQDHLAGPWRRFAEGCHCNRDTLGLIRACGLELGDVQETSWRGMPPIVRPLIVGTATKAVHGRDRAPAPPAACSNNRDKP